MWGAGQGPAVHWETCKYFKEWVAFVIEHIVRVSSSLEVWDEARIGVVRALQCKKTSEVFKQGAASVAEHIVRVNSPLDVWDDGVCVGTRGIFKQGVALSVRSVLSGER